MLEISVIFTLLILFQVKHFICDYPLQTDYMLGKMKPTGEDWYRPLALHAGVHAFFTFLIILFIHPSNYWLYLIPLLDFVIHFMVDRIKASPNLCGRWNPAQPYFWWALGADQMIHHLTHYIFIYVIVQSLK